MMVHNCNIVDVEVVTISGRDVCGLKVALTTSQQENYHIIRAHWQKFNKQLRDRKLQQNIKWQKFGVITKVDGAYFYLSAIHRVAENPGFTTIRIEGGKYAKFCHRGSLQGVKLTVYDIYKTKIPRSDLKIDMERSLIHFEQYDDRFHWNRSDSIIDIYVPLMHE